MSSERVFGISRKHRQTAVDWVVALAVAWLALLSQGLDVAKANPLPVTWENLLPKKAKTIDDPFKALTEDQLYKLSMVARYRFLGVTVDDMKNGGSERAKLESELFSEGINIDWLLAQRDEVKEARKRVALAMNPDIVGSNIEIKGYPVQVAPSVDGYSQFYLVSNPRYCSHVRLPPPNQMILVLVPNTDNVMHHLSLVRIRGRIEHRHHTATVHFIDGITDVTTIYTIAKAEMEVLRDPGSATFGGLLPSRTPRGQIISTTDPN